MNINHTTNYIFFRFFVDYYEFPTRIRVIYPFLYFYSIGKSNILVILAWKGFPYRLHAINCPFFIIVN